MRYRFQRLLTLCLLVPEGCSCDVCLSDVSIDGQHSQSNSAWTVTFRESRWFTRGWTLQELIAPTLVDFFSSEGERLGSKLTLEQ
jgi:hypothetical protein